MGQGLDKFQGVLAGNRKVVIFVFAIVGLVLLHLLGDLGASEAASSLWKLVAAFMAGNGLEHLGDGMAAKPPAIPADTGGEG